MPKYILCPRCELNYILEGEEYCDVCKAELKIGPQLMFSASEELEGQYLCPVCKSKYVDKDEEMCESCRENSFKRRELEDDIDFEKDEEWRQYLDEDEKDVLSSGDDEEELLLSQIEEEEAFDDMEADEDEDLDPYTNEKISKNKKDDDDFDYVVLNDDDYEDDDFEDDEDEDVDEY